MLPSQPGRLLSEEALGLVAAVQTESPEFEFVSRHGFGEGQVDPERAEALKKLANLQALLPANAQFKDLAPEDASSWPLVAVKKSKLNAFNDRDGIQFYALREIQILQRLLG